MSKAKWAVTWDDLRVMLNAANRTIFRTDALRAQVMNAPKRYQRGLALALSVAKWAPGILGRGEGACGLCALYLHKEDMIGESFNRRTTIRSCRDCPLFKADGERQCDGAEDSLWMRWRWSRGQEEQYRAADAIYNALLDMYQREYARVCGG
jgi:hypothetical protein